MAAPDDDRLLIHAYLDGELDPANALALEARIANDPAYGQVVCFCERVTAGEIRDAMDGAGVAHLGTDAPVHDIAAVARGFGSAAATTSSLDELEVLLRYALAAGGPSVIELRDA